MFECKIEGMKNLFIYVFLGLIFCSSVSAKIDSPDVYRNLYEGCKKGALEENPPMPIDMVETYCSCFSDGIVDKLTVEELVYLELEIWELASEEEQMRALVTNKNIKEILAKCLIEAFE